MNILTLSLLIGCMIIFPGCKGDTGAQGPPGTPGGSFGAAACSDCHHLSDLDVTEFSETFISGLAGSDVTITGGTGTTVSFVASKLPAGETAQSYQWTRTGGQTATITAPTASFTAVTLPVITDYKAELVKHVGGLIVSEETSTVVVSDRTAIVAVNPLNLEEAAAAEFKLRVATTSGKYYYGLVKVKDSTGEAALENIAAVNPGLPTVPVNVPVLLRTATNAGGYNWTLSTNPSLTAAISDNATQYPSFVPDVPGEYMLTETISGTTVAIYAGTWRGAITGTDANNVPIPDTVSCGCHFSGALGATDNFTPWQTSGHAHIFSQNLNAGGHYGPDCFPCHTVGFNPATAAVNNGFDDQPGYSAFIADSTMVSAAGAGADANRYSRMWSTATYSALARQTNIQCENCHGPQSTTDANTFIASHATSTSAPGREGPRTSMSADVCGICHGEPQRHARFQQWEESGHGNYFLAVDEGLSSATSTTLRNSCAGCHTAQGFLIFLQQLQAGNPTRNIPNNIPATIDTVQPQTCQVCHDPHAPGSTSGDPNNATVRITDNTPKLPGGFQATGVGRGAICIICHNSRNGTSGSNSYLHQDGDPVFGNLTAYDAPHISCQGDVLMGHNAYFVGSGNYRSPHASIADTCTTCHMELTAPPPLLSYNLAGTNHTFKPSLAICSECHSANTSIGPHLQVGVGQALDELEKAITDKITSRYTGTVVAIDQIVDLGSRGTINIISGGTPTTLALNTAPGLRLCSATVTTNCLETDDLAKALWNFYLIEEDQSGGVHNPDFVRAVIAGSFRAVDGIPERAEPIEN